METRKHTTRWECVDCGARNFMGGEVVRTRLYVDRETGVVSYEDFIRCFECQDDRDDGRNV